MAEKQASYIQASSHPADTDRLVLEALLNPSPAPVSGAAFGVGPTVGDLLVTQKATPNMSVDVAAGHVWIDGTEAATQGAYHGYNDATKNLVVAASDPTNPRKDLVVAKVQDAAYSGATNAWSLAVVTGTPAASPVEPAVPANAVVLAMLNVAALATTITNANVTDRRRRACGLSGIAVCLSTTRPAAPYQGQFVYETDTGNVMLYDGAAWVQMIAAGTWASYTPTVKFGGVTATIANDSRWTRQGRTVHVEYAFRLVNLNAGTGVMTLTRPVNGRAPDTTVRQSYGSTNGVATLFDVSSGGPYKLTLGGNSADQSDFACHTIALPGATMTHAVPLALAVGALNTGDEFWARVVYEAAS